MLTMHAAAATPRSTLLSVSSSAGGVSSATSPRPPSRPPQQPQPHPVLQSLAAALESNPSTATAPGHRRQPSSNSTRRKLTSPGSILQPLTPTASGSTSIDPFDSLPPSALPSSAHIYIRPPITNFVASLATQSPTNRQWETLIFPSANPLHESGGSGGGGGETEIARLQNWFETTWTHVEQIINSRVVQEKRQELRLAGKKGVSNEEKGDSNSNSALAPSTVRELDFRREQLVQMVFQELLRHVTAHSKRRGALLEKIWFSYRQLHENLLSHRLAEMLTMSEASAKRAVDRMTNEFQELLRKEKAAQIQAGVDLSYLKAELEAKSRIISNLQEENDKDLLYSNQIVCHKEMAFLKLEREAKQTVQENMKLTEDLKYLSDDKLNLEDQLQKLEEDREELQSACNQMQEQNEARLRGKLSVETQYDANDAPPEPSEYEKKAAKAAVSIQKVFRGFSQRRKLKSQGLLSRKVTMKKLALLQAQGVGITANGVVHRQPTTNIPKAFSHLMSPIDAALNRTHFIRLFSRKNLLKWILKLYLQKIQDDAYHARIVRYRKDFGDFIYDFYLIRHGSRDAAEMDLLDLFLSVEKNAESSPRVKFFSQLISNNFHHRKIAQRLSVIGSKEGHSSEAPSMQGSPAQAHRVRFHRQHSSENTHVHLLEHHGKEAVEMHKERADHAHQYHMNEQERLAQEQKMRLLLSLNGGRILTSRVLDFYLQFLQAAMKYGTGPFQNVSDNNDGVMWIELNSLIDISAKTLNRFRRRIIRKVCEKMRNKSSASRSTVMQSDSGMMSAPISMRNADMLQAAYGAAAASSPNSAADPNSTAMGSNRFVDFDMMMEVLIEAYIEEDSRMHHMLYDLFLHVNPEAAWQKQKDGRSAAAMRSANRQKKQATSNAAKNTMAAANGFPPSSNPDGPYSSGTDLDDDEDDFLTRVSEAESANLEAEMFSFHHFSDVLRALGCSWEEERILRVYQLAIQRAVYRSVTIEDFVVTARCFGIMPVDVDFELLDRVTAAQNAPIVTTEEDHLPSLDDLGLSSQDSVLERKHQELKEKLRELESGYTLKLEHAHRRFDRELAQVKQAHERELNIMQQTQIQLLESSKRQLDGDRSKAASDYNTLFESSAVEIQNLKLAIEQAKTKETENLNHVHQQFKLKLQEASASIHLLQTKLQGKSEKYNNLKKVEIVALRTKIEELEKTIDDLKGKGGSMIYLQTTLAQYENADKENRAINAALQAELEEQRRKYQELSLLSKKLLLAQQQAAGPVFVNPFATTSSANAQNDRDDDDEDDETESEASSVSNSRAAITHLPPPVQVPAVAPMGASSSSGALVTHDHSEAVATAAADETEPIDPDEDLSTATVAQQIPEPIRMPMSDPSNKLENILGSGHVSLENTPGATPAPPDSDPEEVEV